MKKDSNILDFVAERAKRQSGACDMDDQRVAASLDRDLMEAVQRLEGVATCQQAQAATLEAGERSFIRFCAGLEEVGIQMLGHLSDRFLLHSGVTNTADRLWIYQSRGSSLIAWIVQLAQVHGLAFEDEGSERTVDEQIALTALGRRLSAHMQDQISSFRNHSSGGV